MSEFDGTYEERKILPVRVSFGVDKRSLRDGTIEEIEYAVLHGKRRGEKIKITNPKVFRKVLRYLNRYTEYEKVSELRKVAKPELAKILTKAVVERNKPMKFLQHPSTGKLVGVTSGQHKQISWDKVRDVVENAVGEVYKETESHEFSQNHWAYRMPLGMKYVEPWADVYGGSNVGFGRCAIKVSSRIRTTRPFGKHAPCLNWARFWGITTKWFSIEVRRLSNVVELVGLDKLEGFFMKAIHITSTEFSIENLKYQFEKVRDSTKAIIPIINQSVHEPLEKSEMQAILLAYQYNVNLPEYITEEIMDAVREETVWGFSNAISCVRTHSPYKRIKLPREQTGLTYKLDNIAAEVLSLTPTIKEIKEKVGKIDIETLLRPKPKIYAR